MNVIQEEEEKGRKEGTEQSSSQTILNLKSISWQESMASVATVDSARDRGLQDYRKKLLEHKEVESRLKESKSIRSFNCKVKFFCQIIAGRNLN